MTKCLYRKILGIEFNCQMLVLLEPAILDLTYLHQEEHYTEAILGQMVTQPLEPMSVLLSMDVWMYQHATMMKMQVLMITLVDSSAAPSFLRTVSRHAELIIGIRAKTKK